MRPPSPPAPAVRAAGGAPWWDLALAGALAALAVVELATGITGAPGPGGTAVDAGQYTAAMLATVPLALRSWAPVPVGLGVCALHLLTTLLVVPAEVFAVAVATFVVAPYTAVVGARSPRAAVLAGGAAAVLLGVQGLVDPRFDDGSAVVNAVYAGFMGGVAWVVRRYRDHAETADRLAAAQAELAVEAERRRVSRELHDVVAHGLSVVVLRARGAVHEAATAPDSAAGALRDIDRVATAALADMRRLLAVTDGPGGAGAPPLTPQPVLGDLDGLVDDVRGSGLDVRLTVSGAPRPLTPGAELAVYRVVQEALTNVVRHARASSARICLQWCPGELTVEVLDDGTGPPAAAAGGRGLGGMRERVELVGGRLETGPAPGRGFRVHATVPVCR